MSLFLDPKLVPVSEPLPTSPQEIVDLVSQFTGIGGLGGFSGINLGSSTPAVGDQDKPWFKVDVDGNTLGWHYFVGGIWRPENPIGLIYHFGHDFASAPVGFALCNGVGTYFDEDLVEHDIPDYRDRVVIGSGNLYNLGDTPGLDTQSVSVTLPANTGAVTLSIANLPPHDHDFTTPGARSGGAYQNGTNEDFRGEPDFNGTTASVGSGQSFTVPLGGSANGSVDVRQASFASPSLIWLAV